MPFVPPPHTPFQWHDLPAVDTPLDAADLIAAETDLVTYTQEAATALDTYSSGQYSTLPVLVAAGNLGAAHTIDFTALSAQTVTLSGTLNANCTLTFQGLSPGNHATLLLLQDGTGGRTLTISDGMSSSPVVVNSDPGSVTEIQVDSPNGTDLYVSL